METWGSRVVTAVLGVVGGALVLALALICAPIVVWLAATSEVPEPVRRRAGRRRG